MDPEIERGGDHEHPAGLEDAEYLVERSANLEDVFKCLEAEDGSGRGIGKANGRDIFNPVHSRPRPHIAADVGFLRKHHPEIGVPFLPLHLERAELVNRCRTVECLGHQAAEGLVVVAHVRRSSLRRAGEIRKPDEELLPHPADGADLRTIPANGQAEQPGPAFSSDPEREMAIHTREPEVEPDPRVGLHRDARSRNCWSGR